MKKIINIFGMLRVTPTPLSENLTDTIEQIQNVQGDINNYQNEVSDIFKDTNASSPTDFLSGPSN